MNRVKGVWGNKIRERPFDFYVALVLFLTSIYGIVDDNWPESFGNGWETKTIIIISIYLMLSSLLIMWSLGSSRKRCPVSALMGEMYGWLFVSSASVAIVLTYLGSILGDAPESWWNWSLLCSVWIAMAIASIVRFAELVLVYRSLKR